MNLAASIPLPIQRFIQRTIPENVREAIAWCLPAWGISRLALIIWATVLWALGYTSSLYPFDMIGVFYYGIKPIDTGLAAPLIGTWLRWDTIHYLRIALYGYHDPQDIMANAFFPLYPVLGRIVGWVFGKDYFLALLIISNIAFLAALVLLYRLVQVQFSAVVAQRSLILLLAAPGAFFFFAAYPHSLLLLFAVLCFYLASRQKWLWCTVVGVLAGLTHSTAAVLAFPIALYSLSHWWSNKSWKNAPVLLTPLGPLLGVVLFFAWRIQQGFPGFYALQLGIWDKHFIFPWQIVPLFLGSLSDFRIWIDLGLMIANIGLLPLVWKRVSKEQAFFLASAILLLSTTGVHTQPIPSFFRYSLFAFPFFIGLALWAKQRYTLIFLVFATLQLLLSGLFIVWGFVG